jgi:ribosome assembly protein 4
MEIDTETTAVEKRMIINNVMCLLTDPDGAPLGAPMYLPQNIGPQQLQLIVNQLLHNVIITLLLYNVCFNLIYAFRLMI